MALTQCATDENGARVLRDGERRVLRRVSPWRHRSMQLSLRPRGNR